MEPGPRDVGVRAAVHALDAALAEHRRAITLAAAARERTRMADARAVKAAAAASTDALEQPAERPMRGLRVAETWLEVERVRHPLTPAVRTRLADGELSMSGDGWSARLVLPPGDGPAAAARDAAARVEAAARSALAAAGARLARVVDTSRDEAAACRAAATALAAADRRIAELHADRLRADGCAAELAERLGPRRYEESPDAAAARGRLEQSRLYLEGSPAQPHAWVAEWPADVAGAILRDLPEDCRTGAEPAMRRLIGALNEREPLLALAATDAGVVAATPERVLVAGAGPVASHRADSVPADDLAGASEQRPGRLAETIDLVRAARPDSMPGPAPASAAAAADDPVELLRRLGELRDRGVVSAAEFDAKKAELLRRI